MRNPNSFGTVYKLGGRRRKPWVAMITTGWMTTVAREGKNKDKEIPKQLRQVIGYFETKQEGMDALALHRISPVSSKANITLEELYKEWSDVKFKDISRSTAGNYRIVWSYMTAIAKIKFRDIRTSHWQAIANNCAAKGLSHSSLSKVKTVAVMLCNYAMQNDIVNKNYATFITLPKRKKEKQGIFTDAHIKKMLDNAGTVPWVDTILIMIYTGMRISEMLELTKFNVDIENGVITGGLKTEAEKGRIIPVHPKIMGFMKNWYAKNGDALICRENGSKMSAKYYREKYYYPALEQLEIERLTPHSCRHTFGSLMARAKVNPKHIQEIIGHTDYAFTANEYTHPQVEELKKSISKI